MNEVLLEYYALCAVKSGAQHLINVSKDMVSAQDYSRYFHRVGKKIALKGTIIGGKSPARVYI